MDAAMPISVKIFNLSPKAKAPTMSAEAGAININELTFSAPSFFVPRKNSVVAIEVLMSETNSVLSQNLMSVFDEIITFKSVNAKTITAVREYI
jgi:hypothetical protein